jgi:hypothetical protein
MDTIIHDHIQQRPLYISYISLTVIMGADQNASRAPEFRVPSSEFRGGDIRLPRRQKRKTDQRVATSEFRGWRLRSSEFRVKKKERKKDRSEGGDIRVPTSEGRSEGGDIRVPSSEVEGRSEGGDIRV